MQLLCSSVGSGSLFSHGLPSRKSMRHGGEGTTALRKSIWGSQSHCQGQSQLLWWRPMLHGHVHQRDLGLTAPLDMPGLGPGDISLHSSLSRHPPPAHPGPPAHGCCSRKMVPFPPCWPGFDCTPGYAWLGARGHLSSFFSQQAPTPSTPWAPSPWLLQQKNGSIPTLLARCAPSLGYSSQEGKKWVLRESSVTSGNS